MGVVKRIRLIILICFILRLIIACENSPSKAANDSITVSIVPLQYLMEEIAGDDFKINVLVPPGASPETYEPTPAQLKQLSRSKAYFQTGLIDFEQALSGGFAFSADNVFSINLSENLELIAESGHVHGHAHASQSGHNQGIDPHVWLSPARMKIMSGKIAETLIEIQPDSARKYRANLRALTSAIDSIDNYISQSFSSLQRNAIAIYHPFLTYYCDDYGLAQLAVEQEGKEPSVSHMKALINEFKTLQINTIFYQSQLHQHTVETLVREAAIHAVPVDPMAHDWKANILKITDLIHESLTP